MFIHLHNHSHCSLLDGLPKIDEYIEKCLEYKMPAMALTDHGALYGVIEFYQKAKVAGIKPILGVETYVAPRRLIYKKAKIDASPNHLILLAKNNVGYKNLLELATIAQVDGFYYKPRLDKEILKKYSKGLIATSACWAGEIARALLADDFDEALKVTKEYQQIFGQENFYLEMVDLGDKVKNQKELHSKIKELGKKTKAAVIVTKDAHYLEKDDAEAQDVLLCINTGTTLDQEKRLSMRGFDCSFTHPKVMTERYKDYPEAIENTEKIAKECNVKLDLGSWNFPTIELPKNKTADEILKENALLGIKKKVSDFNEDYKKRLDYELEIIQKKGYSPYFLVVADIINWAKSQGIIVTTRGSAAGSLVSFAIGIIDINPMFFKLPFERFLNPFRPSPPDIDMDFADNRREEVLNYAKEKYGEDKVAQICTFGTMMARGSVRDVTRVLGLPYEFGDRLAKMIPFGSQGFPMTINKALEINPEFKKNYQSDKDTKRVIDLARKIEGCARHASIHAAGTLISPTKITDYVPLQRDPSGRKKITQFEMKSSEAAGLLKFDFLGIANLSIMGEAIKIIKKKKGVDVELQKLPLDDEKTFKLLAQGRTVGLFQLSGEGMTKYLIDLKPTNIFDIMAMVALYRPGPMESIPEFVARKHDPSKITYLDERMKNILDQSYGIITYQDDVMLIAINLAGYDWKEADKFRKAMGKKIPEEMAAQEGNFKKGCIKNGLSQEKTEKLWQLIKPFAAYGFNKAHAASYGLVAYQTAYLKANYPAEYMTALLSIESGEEEKIATACTECEKMGIKVLPPDINYSRKDFTYISEKEIRFGLLAIKNLGSDIIAGIIKEREKNGSYKSLTDLLNRVKSRNLNKKSLEALAKAGALDSLIERNMVIENMDQILNYLKLIRKDKNNKQTSLFASADQPEIQTLNLKKVEPVDNKTKLAWEKELLGLYVSAHPFTEYIKLVDGKISSLEQTKKNPTQEKIIAAGIITNSKKIFTKNNEPMMFVTLEDSTTNIEIVVFPKVLQKTQEVLNESKVVLVLGKISIRNDQPNLLLDEAYLLTEETADEMIINLRKKISAPKNAFLNNGYNKKYPENTAKKEILKTVWVTLPRYFNSEIHHQIKEIFMDCPGECQVCIKVNHSGNLRKIETSYKIEYNENIKLKIEKITGQGSVNVK